MPRTKESVTTELSAAEKLEACIEWVEHGIAKTLEFDPSGFLLGTEAVAVVDALREVEAERDALREALEAALPWIGVGEGRRGNWCPPEIREAARAALERHP